MKIKIMISRKLSNILAILSLCNAGVVWSLPEVESRTQVTQEQGFVEMTPAESSAPLDMTQKMELLQQEVQELRGKVEEQNYQLQQMQAQQKKLYLDLEHRMRDGSSAKASNTTGITIEPDAQVTPDAKPELLHDESAAEEKAYQKAYHLVQNKKYDEALLAFKSLIKSFPEGKYAPNAHYWCGEIQLIHEDLELAARSFEIVHQNYPQHPKAADSLLKLGYVEYAKGQWKQSQALFTQVKNQFPGTTSAQLADARLQKMQEEGHL